MKAAIYCRLSEEDRNKLRQDEDSRSIQNQKAMLTQYAMAQGWQIADIYSDEDYAGADRNRPAFNRLIQDARNGNFQIVLCKTQSRFTREMELVERVIHGLFPRWGIRFVSIVDNADTADKGNKKSRQINGLVNEWYLEDMSENIRSVLTSRRKNGYHIGAFALYGYRKDPERKGGLLVDEEAACVVRQVFSLYANGMGKTAIARYLNDRGILNPTEYKRKKGLRYQQPKGKGSMLWRYESISSMLENEIYIGNLVQGKYGSISFKTKENKPKPKAEWIRVEGTHQPIIEPALWEMVQRLRTERTRQFSNGTVGCFARKVRCMECGYILSSSMSHGKHYLKCRTRDLAKNACSGAFVPVAELERIVLAELKQQFALYADRALLIKKAALPDGGTLELEQLTKKLANERKLSDDFDMALAAVYLDRAKGTMEADTFWNVSQTIQQEKKQLSAHITAEEERVKELILQKSQQRGKAELVDDYLNPQMLDRALMDQFISTIEIGRRDPDTKELPIRIHWRF